MSNDELLALIDKEVFTIVSVNDPSDIEIARLRRLKVALRAVVELHKPDLENLCGECTSAGISMDSWELVAYPCPTIQAIEKELK